MARCHGDYFLFTVLAFQAVKDQSPANRKRVFSFPYSINICHGKSMLSIILPTSEIDKLCFQMYWWFLIFIHCMELLPWSKSTIFCFERGRTLYLKGTYYPFLKCDTIFQLQQKNIHSETSCLFIAFKGSCTVTNSNITDYIHIGNSKIPNCHSC